LSPSPLTWAERSMRLYGAFAAGLLGILAVTAAMVAALQQWESSNGSLTHTYEVREALNRILTLSVECEGALRGYVITGKDTPIRRFRNNESALRPALDAVQRLTTDNPEQLARLEKLRSQVETMLAEMTRVLTVKEKTAEPLVHDVRATLSEMLNVETELLARRRVAWVHQQRVAMLVSLGGSLLLLALLGIAAFVVRADLREREQRVRERAALYQFQERLIGIVGHDLRNPLSAVLISAQMLLKKKHELRENQQQALERILRSASRIDALGNLLVDFTHARLGGGVPLRRELSDARPSIERAVDELRSANPKRSLSVEFKSENTNGFWDAERIAQVVSNLLTNAIRYGAKDSPIAVTVSDAPADQLEIAVHNQGPPIAAELIPHIFEPYKRGDDAQRHYAAGLGLGLYIVREIANAHQGTVLVESLNEAGTTFRVRLPRASVQ
jgi:signal transduction histidine kinase